MAKNKISKEQEKSFEMIELATANIELLTRAFKTISEVCEHRNSRSHIKVSEKVREELLN